MKTTEKQQKSFENRGLPGGFTIFGGKLVIYLFFKFEKANQSVLEVFSGFSTKNRN